jgi:polar amino acid transport system substrate-binding protein
VIRTRRTPGSRRAAGSPPAPVAQRTAGSCPVPAARRAPGSWRGWRGQGPGALPGLALVVVALLAIGCTQTDVPESLPGPTTTTVEAAGEPPPPPEGCDEDTVTHSLRPDGPAGTDVEPGTYMATIRDRGRLRVGVDTSTLLFSSVNPRTGDFEGFDIEIAREVASALLGSPDAVEFVAIPKSERVDVLLGDEPLDMVANTFTVNCERAAEIDFSSTYFISRQRLLVRDDEEATSVEGFAGRKVCAPTGSTSIRNLEALPDPPEAVGKPTQADCLVALQQGEVEAVSTDDTILAGMVAQDPNVRIVGEPFSDEPYGIGLPPGEDEWVRYVNAVLDDLRASGRWSEIYDEAFDGRLGDDADTTPPPAVYRD